MLSGLREAGPRCLYRVPGLQAKKCRAARRKIGALGLHLITISIFGWHLCGERLQALSSTSKILGLQGSKKPFGKSTINRDPLANQLLTETCAVISLDISYYQEYPASHYQNYSNKYFYQLL